MIALAMLLAGQEPASDRIMPSITGLDRPCPNGEGSEIVVCARRTDTDRQRSIEPVPPPGAAPDRTPGSFRFDGNKEVGGELESVQLPGGVTSKQIMVRFKVPF